MDVINTRKRIEEDLSLLKNMIYRMSGLAAESIERAVWALKNNDAEMAQKVIADGDVIDDLEEKLDAACMEFAARYQPLGEDLRVVVSIMHIAVDLERIGDYGKKLLEYYAYRQNRPKDFSQQAMTELSGMYAEAHHAIVTALDGFINDDPDKAREVAPIAGKLRGLEVELRNRHIQRLDKQECDSETGLVYVDILGIIEHIGYHSNNVAKATISSCTAEHKAKA